MDLDALKQTFFLECEELLTSAEESLDALSRGADSEDAVNALFRYVHSIKGGARAFDLTKLADFSHAFESYMSCLRKGEQVVDEESVRLLFDAVDSLVELVQAARETRDTNNQRIEDALVTLRRKAGLDDAEPELSPDADPFDFQPVPVFDQDERAAPIARRIFDIHFAPGPRMMASGVDPIIILRAIKSLGVADIICNLGDMPTLDQLDPNICTWAWSIRLETDESRDALDDIADMVNDLATISILEVEAGRDVLDDETGTALTVTADPAPVVSLDTTPAKPVAAQSAKPKTEKPGLTHAASAPKTVRVEVPKLERLGNMVGELVITQAFIMRQANRLSVDEHPDLFKALEEMSQHIRDLQDSSLALRAQPLKSVFSRFGHLLRDLEKSTGKRIILTESGEDTEIDKTVVERLNEPLTHLIRNAVDHGIEMPDQRIAAGKPPEGRIRLSAEQRGSQVFIELADDGAGIDRGRVRAKAVERGLIEIDQNLTDEEIDDLIFLPGFSTKDAVTDISGRGVGMDAVRQTIVEMGGRVLVRSEPGRGSRFLLTLPLSLAVLDAMITEVGGHRFLIPVHNVKRTIRPEAHQIIKLDRDGAMVSLHGELLRIISITTEFGIAGGETDPCHGLLIIVDGAVDQQRVALLVDDLLGQEPVVVKSLERNYRKVPGIAAATILGDGRAALILDLLTLGQGGRRRGSDHHPATPPKREEVA
jgi:two-component system chemotaxis sensor kinase CheA